MWLRIWFKTVEEVEEVYIQHRETERNRNIDCNYYRLKKNVIHTDRMFDITQTRVGVKTEGKADKKTERKSYRKTNNKIKLKD